VIEKAGWRSGEFSSEFEAIFAKNLIDAIALLRRHTSIAAATASIRTSIDAAVRVMDEAFRNADIGPIVDLLTSEVIKTGAKEWASMPNQRAIGYRFDSSDPRAIEWARIRGGRLITQISDEIRNKVSDVTARLLNGELSRRQAANEISRSVGLHDRWQKAVDNSYNETYNTLIGKGVDPFDAEEMAQDLADKYSARLIKARASNIARTELATAQNQGRYLGWQQAAENGLFNPDEVVKEWRTAPEFVSSKTEVCPICEPLDGVQAPIWAEFPEVGVVMPPAHPNCRCRAVLIVTPIEQVVSFVEDARARLGY